MIRTLVFISLIATSLSPALSQEIVKKEYYKDKFKRKAATEQYAKYVMLAIKNSDGSETKEFRRVKDDFLITSETFMNDSPYGVWKTYDLKSGEISNETDYNFQLLYEDDIPDDVLLVNINNGELISEVEGDFNSPSLFGELSFQQQMRTKLRYSRYAKTRGLQGTAKFLVKVPKSGKLELVSVQESAGKYLDMESARFLRGLPDFSPAKLDGEAIEVFALVTFAYRLNDGR